MTIVESTVGPPRTQPSLDDVIDARVDAHIDSLHTEIATLRRALDELQPDRWPAVMFRSEAARYLGMHPDTLDSLVRQGLIAPVQLPGISQRAYPRDELDRFIKSGGR